MSNPNYDPSRAGMPAVEWRTHEREPYSLYGFEVVSPGGIEETYFKLWVLQNTLQQSGLIRVCMDFDNTLSTEFTDATWVAAARTLQHGIGIQSRDQRAGYKSLEAAGLLHPEMEMTWSQQELIRLVLNGEADEALTEASKMISLRTGARRLLTVTNQFPSLMPIIVSGGVWNVIVKVLKHNGIEIPDEQILANRYFPKQPGQQAILPDRAAILGSYNKLGTIEAHFPCETDESMCTLALGDSITDATMAFSGLAIRTGQAGGNDQAYLDKSRDAGFDLVLKTEHLLAVSELLEQLVEVLYGRENR